MPKAAIVRRSEADGCPLEVPVKVPFLARKWAFSSTKIIAEQGTDARLRYVDLPVSLAITLFLSFGLKMCFQFGAGDFAGPVGGPLQVACHLAGGQMLLFGS